MCCEQHDIIQIDKEPSTHAHDHTNNHGYDTHYSLNFEGTELQSCDYYHDSMKPSKPLAPPRQPNFIPSNSMFPKAAKILAQDQEDE